MSPRRTRRGTIRESIIETSIDSNLKNTSKITKRPRRPNKSHAKASEDDSDSPVEVHSSIESSIASASILNETSSKARKRRRGGVEASESQDISLSVTIEEPKKNNAKTPRTKKPTTTNRSRTAEPQAVLSQEESSNVKSEKRVSYNLMSDSEDHSEVLSRKKAKSSKKRDKTLEQSPERVSSKTVPSDKNVTPKNSPILNVSFTPHRSKKTPRKSPVNLGSPKTHSPSPTKFLIKPRKLSILDSPPSSENSLQQINVSNAGNVSSQSIGKDSRSSKAKLNDSSSKKKSITPFKPRPTFSKSPKIVLKTPKSSKKTTPKGSAASVKSKKSSPSKQKKSPVKFDESLKSGKSAKSASLSVTEISGLINFDETITISPTKTPNKSANTSINTPAKSTRITSPAKSRLDLNMIPKVVLSSVSAKKLKSPKPASPLRSKNSPKKSSPIKSAVSPKTKLASISKGTPKIMLVKRSPAKSAKKSSSSKTKSGSPSKAQKSPSKSKSLSINTSQESSQVSSSVKIELGESSSDLNSKSTPIAASPKKSKKSLSPSKSKKSPTKSARPSLNTSSLSSKKMPRIVLTLKKKSPLKSSKSTTPTNTKKSLEGTSPKTPKVLVTSPKRTSVSKTDKVPVKQRSRKSSPTKNTSKNTTMSPKVVVSKLSSPELRNNSLRAKENQPSITLVPVDHAVHTPKASVAKSPTRKSASPAKSAKSPKSVAKRSIGPSTSSKTTTPSSVLGNKFLSLKPKSTSTPRERGKPARSPVGKAKIIKRLNDQSTIQDGQPFLEDESEPSLDNSSLIRMSDVFDVDTPRKNNTFDKSSSKNKSPRTHQKLNNSDTFEADKSPNITSRRSNRSGTFEVTKASPNKSKKNNTYEVKEPKTPGLKRTVNKAGVDLDGEPSVKKSRRVNFTSPARESVRASSINRLGTPAHPTHQRKTPISIKAKTPLQSVVRSRISSVGLDNKTPASTPLNKRTSISADPSKSRRSNYNAQVASVNRLSRPKTVTDSQKKLVTKTPVTRKIPNFAEIHQKNFAKMESLVDLKKRVEKRHVVLNSGSAKKAATESTNGAYNRFGFKVRKNEAVSLISKKQTASADSRQQKRENARSALQGVRMNRRFELQMKARIKTS